MPEETILVFAAHNDDGVIGAGGTLAKYAKEGKKVKTIVFSFGEMSHPHLKPEVIKLKRYKEAIEGDKILGGSGMAFLALREMRFKKDAGADIKKVIRDIIEHEQPSKIFTHSINDPMPDHQAAYRVVLEVIKEMNYHGELYTFDVWNIFNIFHRNKPRMVVDVSDTFIAKTCAFRAHRSQKSTIFLLLGKIYLQAISNGLSIGCTYAESFVRLQ